jgi:hypothetical protein
MQQKGSTTGQSEGSSLEREGSVEMGINRRIRILAWIILVWMAGIPVIVEVDFASAAEYAFQPDWNPPYPRVGQMYLYHPGQAPEIWKDHDLVIIRHRYEASAQEIKQRNPDVIQMAASGHLVPHKTKSTFDGFPMQEAYFIKCPDGSGCKGGKLDSWHQDYGFINITPAYPHEPKAYSVFAEWLASAIDFNVFDGIFFDYWARQIWGNAANLASIDGDSTPDGKKYVNEQWELGNQALISDLRRMLPDTVIFANEAGQTYLNGNSFEFWTKDDVNSRRSNFNLALELQTRAVPPQILFANSEAGLREGDFTGPTFRADFTSSQIVGAFFGHDEGTTAHRFTYLHDEYLADLGHPLPGDRGQPKEIGAGSGLWVRYFEKGCVISNISGVPRTVSDSDLDGRIYWRFLGGQEPEFNDGSPFSSVNLAGMDGIMLFTEPTTLITPVVIDNVARNMTSLGQQPAQFEGNWQQVRWPDNAEKSNTGYGLGIFWGEEENIYATTTGQGRASYRPEILLPGRYEIFEWHPDLGADGQGAACTGVTAKISHGGGSTDMSIDQSASSGQWNSLGTYLFGSGGGGEVILISPGGCTTAADAIRWVWRGVEGISIFADVPIDHWAYGYIEALYRAGYVAGCSTDPLRYCPEATMTRAESAVFVVRGVHSAEFLPAQPMEPVFEDVPLWEWFADWTAQLWEDGYTAGCGTDPLIYCPFQEHTRAEGAVFFLRIQNGKDYLPSEPMSAPYTDVALGTWYAKWVAAAKEGGLTEPCEAPAERGDDRFRPEETLTRAEAACMMVKAKGLP